MSSIEEDESSEEYIEDESSEEYIEDESSEEYIEDESSEEYIEDENLNKSPEKLTKDEYKKEFNKFFKLMEEKFSTLDDENKKTPTELFEETLRDLKKGK